MLVDRIFNCRFDSLEFERENGYRHPHLYHCNIIEAGEQEEKARENCVENIHVQILN
jgi:hypothetical protein